MVLDEVPVKAVGPDRLELADRLGGRRAVRVAGREERFGRGVTRGVNGFSLR